MGQLAAATVDTVLVQASAMDRKVKVLIVVPSGKRDTTCPVVYALHGYSCDETFFPNALNVDRYADQYGFVVVCPDGNNSWYWDSPVEANYRYETFISKDLPAYVDTHYKTIASPAGRGITGFSMGGHGALWNAIRHQDVFGAAGSMSGGVDIRPFPENWEMKRWLGAKAQNETRWDAYTVINQLDKLQDGGLSLFIDCGTSDFFYEVNNNLHAALVGRKIRHTYLVTPGKHDTAYWRNCLQYQSLFFHLFFTKGKFVG
jgi:S-formylglutathione hydrolase FrmB